MPTEGKEWALLTRRKNGSGGAHVYIDQFALETALDSANIPIDVPLKIRRYPMKDRKGTAILLIKIREDDKE